MLLVALTLSTAAKPAAARVLMVDDDGVDCPGAPFTTIMAAVNDSDPGDEIDVCAGTYAEQVIIPRPIGFFGISNGTRRPLIKPQTLQVSRPSLVSGLEITGGIIVEAHPVFIDNFDLDLSTNDAADCTPFLTGIFYRNATGSISNSRITGVRVAGKPACESGVGVYVESGRRGSLFGVPLFGRASLKVFNLLVEDYQKAGFAANGRHTRVQVFGSRAHGGGPPDGPGQIGFQLALEARGRIEDSQADMQVSNIAGESGVGILLFSVQRAGLRRNTMDRVGAGIGIVGDRARIRNGEIGNAEDGVVVFGDRNNITDLLIGTTMESGIFVNGEHNQIGGGAIAHAPVGVWLYKGATPEPSGIQFISVPEPIRIGGTRNIGRDIFSPFVGGCSSNTQCDDFDSCSDDTCDFTIGACTHKPHVCFDGNTCTVDTCDPKLGCRFLLITDGAACGTPTLCDGTEHCIAGLCTAGPPTTCDDSNDCTFDLCNGTTCVSVPELDGTICTNGTCTAGICR